MPAIGVRGTNVLGHVRRHFLRYVRCLPAILRYVPRYAAPCSLRHVLRCDDQIGLLALGEVPFRLDDRFPDFLHRLRGPAKEGHSAGTGLDVGTGLDYMGAGLEVVEHLLGQ